MLCPAARKNYSLPVYDYFLRSISSANDQPADLEWMSHFELLHGYFLIGHYNFHIWPIWDRRGREWEVRECPGDQEHVG